MANRIVLVGALIVLFWAMAPAAFASEKLVSDDFKSVHSKALELGGGPQTAIFQTSFSGGVCAGV